MTPANRLLHRCGIQLDVTHAELFRRHEIVFVLFVVAGNLLFQGSGRGLEAMKWVVVVALLLVAIVGNYLYRDIMLPLRALAVVILIAAGRQENIV